MDEKYSELDATFNRARSRVLLLTNRCHAGTVMGRNDLLAAALMRSYNFTDEEHEEFVRQTLIDLCTKSVTPWA